MRYALADGLCIIWLDTYIGVMGQYQTLKQQFQSSLGPVAAMPPNGINELICYFEEKVAPIKFTSTIDDALSLIQAETDKRIIFISSDVLGIESLTEWALEHGYDCFMQIFDFEIDLLVHLVRDCSNDLINLGRSFMAARDGQNARKCFVTAQTLEISANEIDHTRTPLMTRLQLLISLISQARDL